MDKSKTAISNFLVYSFVEDYEYNRAYVDHLNYELEELGIPYQYSYDEFCIELLNRFLELHNRFAFTMRELRERFSEMVYNSVREMKKSMIMRLQPVYVHA